MNGATELELQRWSRGLRVTPVVWLSALLMLAIALALWLRGASFYGLPLAERIDHVDYAVLSPNRPTGRVYGAVGLGLILLNLTYLLRRRFPHWPLGRMRLWLDAHVVTGLTATLFVAFHSAFQLRSVVAMVTATTLAMTVFTGLTGRFFYALVPRRGSRLLRRIDDLDALLPGVGRPLQDALAKVAVSEPDHGAGLWRVLRMLPRWRYEARLRRRLVAATCWPRVERAEGLERQFAAPLARELAGLAAREVHAVAGRELLRAWRPWHRLCALAMIAGIMLHIGVALFYGYGWDFAA